MLPVARRPAHLEELPLAACRRVHVDANGSEPCSLVDLDRTLVEGRHGEDEPLRRVPPARELEPGGEERSSEPATGQVRTEPEADLDCSLLLWLEGEVADEVTRVVLHGPVGLAAKRGIEKLAEVVGIRRPVVEGERLGIAPPGDRLGVLLAQLREVEPAYSRLPPRRIVSVDSRDLDRGRGVSGRTGVAEGGKQAGVDSLSRENSSYSVHTPCCVIRYTSKGVNRSAEATGSIDGTDLSETYDAFLATGTSKSFEPTC
jgi:hypothetical protein